MIKGLKVEIDGTEITIPIEKAKELYKDLDILFGKKSNVTYTNPFDWTAPTAPTLYGKGTDMYKATFKL